MSTVYGPVSSWRFGRSLGIDVVSSPKKCTFNCIYCQLGKTEVHIPGPEGLNEKLVDINRVINDLKATLKLVDLDTVDIVTFSGMGEPTLNLELGKIAREVKTLIEGVPLAILTNSSLFIRDDVRKGLRQFDVVVAKLDAGDDETFRLINRPADNRLEIKTIVDSIKGLRREFRGVLALEVMLLSSKEGQVTNIEGGSLRKLLDAVLDVKPDLVQLEVPYRPPSESFVHKPSRERIEQISRELAEALGEDRLWVYGRHDRRGKHVKWIEHVSFEREALDLLKRRPCRIVDVSASLGISSSAAKSLLKDLEKRNLISRRVSGEERYYSYKSG